VLNEVLVIQYDLPGADPDIFVWGGALEGPVLQQGELSMVCVGLSERDLLQLHDVTRKIFGGQWHPLAPPLRPTEHVENIS